LNSEEQRRKNEKEKSRSRDISSRKDSQKKPPLPPQKVKNPIVLSDDEDDIRGNYLKLLLNDY